MDTILIHPILNLLVLLYKGFMGIGLPGSLGFAILALTLIVKLVLHPLTAVQTRSMKKMQELKPHVDSIREKHKKDTMRQQKEIAELYRAHKINPASGCLPLLIQLPIFIALYSGLIGLFQNGDPVEYINRIVYAPFMQIGTWDTYFFGLDLRDAPSNWQKSGIFLLSIPIITAILQFFQAKLMGPSVASKSPVQKGEIATKADTSDFASIMQKQTLYFFPIMVGFFSYGFPIGLSLYWNAFTVFGIIQQYLINRGSRNHG